MLVYHPTSADPVVDRIAEALSGRAEVLAASEPDDVLREIADVDALVTHSSLPRWALGPGKSVAWVQLMAAGVEDWVDALPEHVSLTRVTGSFGPRIAEYVIGHMFAVTQRLPDVLRNQAARTWKPLSLDVLRGKRLAVLGLGSVGSEVLTLAEANGLRTVGISRTRPHDEPSGGWYPPDRLEEAVAGCHFFCLAAALTPETIGMVDRTVIEAMDRDAWLVNVGRGRLAVEADLVEALQEDRIGGAVLDVFSDEPLPPDHPLWRMPNVIVTPHHSGSTLPSEVVDVTVRNANLYLEGRPLVNEVDRQLGY